MHKLFVVFLVLLSQTTAKAYDVENIKKILKRDKACVFAVYRVMKGKATRESFPQRFDVACIGDIVVGSGTIREKRGCGAFNLNLETGRMTHFADFGPNIVEGKSCDSGGFDAVIDQLLYNDNSEEKPRKVLVRDFMAPYPESSEPTSFYRFVVYSESDSYRTKLGYGREDIDLKTLDVRKK